MGAEIILTPSGSIPDSVFAREQRIKGIRFSKPQKPGLRMTAWRAEAVRALFEDSANG